MIPVQQYLEWYKLDFFGILGISFLFWDRVHFILHCRADIFELRA